MEKVGLLEKSDISQCAAIVNMNYNNRFRSTINQRLQEMFSTSYNRSKPTYITIKWGKTVVAFGGFAESQFNTGTFEMFLINVHPDFQGNGFGSKIVREILKCIDCKQEPLDEFWVLLNCKKELVDFYHRFGFHATTSRKDGEQFLMTMNTTYLSRNIAESIFKAPSLEIHS